MLCPTIEKGSDAWKWAAGMLYTAGIMSNHRQRLLEKKFLPIPIPRKSDFESLVVQGTTVSLPDLEQDAVKHALESLQIIAGTWTVPLRWVCKHLLKRTGNE